MNVQEALTDIYHFLKHSTKRKTELKEIMELYRSETYRALKHVPTRWLSLGRCLTLWCAHTDLSIWFFHRQFYKSECHHVPKHYDHEKRKNFSLNSILIFHWIEILLPLLWASFHVWSAPLPWQLSRSVFQSPTDVFEKLLRIFPCCFFFSVSVLH